MVIFHPTAVYINHKRLLKNMQKQRKFQRSTRSTYSTFTQPVPFPPTDLRHSQKNFAVLFCSIYINLALFLLSASIHNRILMRIIEKWKQNFG